MFTCMISSCDKKKKCKTLYSLYSYRYGEMQCTYVVKFKVFLQIGYVQ